MGCPGSPDMKPVLSDGPAQPVPVIAGTSPPSEADHRPRDVPANPVPTPFEKFARAAGDGTNAHANAHLTGVTTQSIGFHENVPPPKQSPLVEGPPAGAGGGPVDPPGSVPGSRPGARFGIGGG